MWYEKAGIYYLVAINVLTLLVYGADKLQAKRGGRRVPEATLLGLAAIGGSLGAAVAMWLFRHKTKHKKFTIGVPLIIIAQLAVAFLISRLF